jgi:hypothetical protein
MRRGSCRGRRRRHQAPARPPARLQADWASPRPLWEFLTSLSLPKNQVKWTSRLKCNAYYYRTNYLAMLGLCALGTLFRQPRALLGVGLLIASAMCLNDPFVAALK